MESATHEYFLDNKRIQDCVNSKIIGSKILFYDAVSSTNTVAGELAKSGQGEGTVIIAQTQKEGYGRLRRTWFSPDGGLWLSIILRPKISTQKATFTTIMAGASVAQVLRESCHLEAIIKWPNDVLVNGKKICGILNEMRTKGDEIGFIILGIGLNGNFPMDKLPEDVRKSSTTLRIESGHPPDLENILVQLLEKIDEYYLDLENEKFDRILETWRGYQDTLGRNVRIETQKEKIEGVAVDLDEDGALMVKTKENGLKRILAGDCIHLSRSGGW